MKEYTTEAEVGGDGRVVLDGLPFAEGERVEVTVRRSGGTTGMRDRYPLRGTVVRYDDPFGSVGEDEWEALRGPS